MFLRMLEYFLNIFNVQKLGGGFKVSEKLENIGFGG